MSAAPDPVKIDVLVIGAGINGAGLFRDLCEQGVTAVIIDKADYGSGTSAAPSRLIHGGIKYLETGELRLVAESTLERNLLLQNAPHLVKPLPTIIPMFSWFNGIPASIRTLLGSTTAPRSRGAVLVKIGLALYDFYGARRRIMPRHRFWSKRKALSEMPLLTDRIVAAGTYYDAMVTAPERLVFELVQDGRKAEKTAQAFPYAKLEGTDGSVVQITDSAGKEHAFQPRIVINAAGPWIDKVNAVLGVETMFIGGSKGSHIIVDNPALVAALNGRMIYYEADDGRICLVFDYLGRALVGSTDIRADDPDDVRCTEEETDYFLDSLRMLLPGLRVTRDQIVYSYAGIRPLPASVGTDIGLVSRDHSSPALEPSGDRSFPIVSLVGGKWTTFRGFAEEVCDDVLARLQLTRRISTQDLPIGGGSGLPLDLAVREAWIAEMAEKTGATLVRARTVFERYGTTCEAILFAEKASPQPLKDAPDYSVQELETLCRIDGIARLTDLVIRRTTLAVTGQLTAANLCESAEIAGRVLSWRETRVADELAQAIVVLRDLHGIALELENRTQYS